MSTHRVPPDGQDVKADITAALLAHYCTFSNKTDNTPRARQEPWEAFVKMLSRHTIRRSKDGPMWSPTIYPEGKTRKKDAVEAVTMAVGDVDHGVTFEEIETRLAQYEYLAHSTHSHTPDNPRFRVIIPFTRPVAAADWPDIGTRIREHVFGLAVDTSASDACRAYYLPSCPLDAKDERFAKHHLGEPLDPYGLPPASNSIPKTEASPAEDGQTMPKARLGRDALEFVANGAPIGEQRKRALAAARNYLSAGYSEKDTAEAIWRGLQASPKARGREPWTKAQAIAMVLDLSSKAAPPQPDRESNATPTPTAARRPIIVQLAAVQPEKVEFLWHPYLPLGKLTILEGDPGVGKS